MRSIEQRLGRQGAAPGRQSLPAAAERSAAPAGSAARAPAPAAAPAPPPLLAPGRRRRPAGSHGSPLALPCSLAVRRGPGPVVEDFDDVFEPAPAWKRSAEAAPAPKDETILLLEDEAPTLPGAPFRRRQVELRRPRPKASRPPVTLAFEEPPLPRRGLSVAPEGPTAT